MTYLRGKSILVTGGTGSFGKAFIRYALEHLEPTRIVVGNSHIIGCDVT